MALFFSDTPLLVPAVFVLLLASATKSVALDDDTSEFSYVNGSPTGPSRWGCLRPDWATCKLGKLQSPINLVTHKAVFEPCLGALTYSYNPAAAKVTNDGVAISVDWSTGNAGFLGIDGVSYNLTHLHWHSPAEHTFDGRRLALELHIVHLSGDDKVAVVAIPYKLGEPDPFLSKLECAIKTVARNNGAEADVGDVDLNHALYGCDEYESYYRYNGSLTTPPCSENVTWTVFDAPRTVSADQVSLLKNAVDDDAHNNARPIQPTHGRKVYYYFPKVGPYA